MHKRINDAVAISNEQQQQRNVSQIKILIISCRKNVGVMLNESNPSLPTMCSLTNVFTNENCAYTTVYEPTSVLANL